MTPDGSPPQDRLTAPLKAPAADTTTEIGPLLVPGASVTALGAGALKLKSTTCSTSGNVCVTDAVSVPVACRLKE